MEKTLTNEELIDIFDKLKKKEGNKLFLEKTLYNANLNLVNIYSKKYDLDRDDTMDLYNDIFGKIYTNVFEGKTKPSSFSIYIQTTMAKECLHRHALNNSKKDQEEIIPLMSSYVDSLASNKERAMQREEEVRRQSILIVITVLENISNNLNLRKKYNITKQEISIVRDFYGINDKNNVMTIIEIGQKYNKGELEVKAILHSAMKKIRKIEEFNVGVKF